MSCISSQQPMLKAGVTSVPAWHDEHTWELLAHRSHWPPHPTAVAEGGQPTPLPAQGRVRGHSLMG